MRLRILGFVFLCLLVVAPVAQAAEFHLDGQRDYILRPDHPTNKLVLYIHGATVYGSAITEYPYDQLSEELVSRGFAVASSDANGSQTWGNAASLGDYERLVASLPYKRIYILSQSMGALDAIQLIDVLHPVAWASLFPVCNLHAVAHKFGHWIRSGWHGSVPHSFHPEAGEVQGLPVMLWASPEDKLVPKRYNADVCARWMRRGGAKVTEIPTEGEHGDPSNYEPGRLANFFLARR